MATALYYLGLSALFTHELDAVRHAEWRLLLILRDLPDEVAYPVFVALHLPLFFLFFWLSHHRSTRLRSGFRLAVATFLVVHGLLHWLLSDAPAYGFSGVLSNGLIILAAVSGAAYLALALRGPRTAA